MSDGDHVLQRVTWDELVSVRRFEAYSEELTASYPRHYPYKHGSTRQQQQQQQPSFHTSPTSHSNCILGSDHDHYDDRTADLPENLGIK